MKDIEESIGPHAWGVHGIRHRYSHRGSCECVSVTARMCTDTLETSSANPWAPGGSAIPDGAKEHRPARLCPPETLRGCRRVPAQPITCRPGDGLRAEGARGAAARPPCALPMAAGTSRAWLPCWSKRRRRRGDRRSDLRGRTSAYERVRWAARRAGEGC